MGWSSLCHISILFHRLELADHKLVLVGLHLRDRPRLAGNSSVLEIQDSQEWLKKLIQWVLMGVITRNRWWGSLKHRIKDFTIKYCQNLTLDKARVEKLIEEWLTQVVDGGIPLK